MPVSDEIKYLSELYKGKLTDENPFITYISNDKEIFVIGAKDSELGYKLDKMTQYRTLYETILDLNEKILYSLDEAINYAYSETVQQGFSPFAINSKNEWLSYYNIENALFRIESLWDMLAHLYNIKYDLGEKPSKIYHKRIFSDQQQYLNKYWNGNHPDEIIGIVSYIKEENNIEIEGRWSGNYGFVSTLRNDMIHNYAISKSALSSYTFEIKHHPSFILKRVCEDFSILQDFINNAVLLILEESRKEN